MADPGLIFTICSHYINCPISSSVGDEGNKSTIWRPNRTTIVTGRCGWQILFDSRHYCPSRKHQAPEGLPR